MRTTRICIVGGGSYNWGPTLLKDIASKKEVLDGTVVLHDVDPVALDDMARLGRKIMEQAEAGFAVEATTDLRSALAGAEFVVVTITTGGLETMAYDLEIPLKYGVYQTVGDTVGPGGLSRALRNIPPMLEIARAMEAVCPDAWLINLTNPMSTLTRAIACSTRIKVVGLCHEVDSTRATLLRMFGARPDELEGLVAGINHLPWFVQLRIQGEDGVKRVRRHVAEGRPIPLKPDFEERSPFQDHWKVKLALLDAVGYLAGAGDRHVAEFFPYFLKEQTRFGADYDVEMTPIDLRRLRTEAHREQVRAWLREGERVPLGRSREEFSDIIAALEGVSEPVRTVVNLPNVGQIANLPRDVIVETSAVAGPTGIHPISVGELPLPILATVYPHVINQEMTVQAGIRGDRKLALQALVNDPLVRDPALARSMLDELLRANARWLPQF